MSLRNRLLTDRRSPARTGTTAAVAAGVGLALLAACTSGSDNPGSSTSVAR